jgi:hypothetical protein
LLITTIGGLLGRRYKSKMKIRIRKRTKSKSRMKIKTGNPGRKTALWRSDS